MIHNLLVASGRKIPFPDTRLERSVRHPEHREAINGARRDALDETSDSTRPWNIRVAVRIAMFADSAQPDGFSREGTRGRRDLRRNQLIRPTNQNRMRFPIFPIYALADIDRYRLIEMTY